MAEHRADGTPGDGRDDRLFDPAPWTARDRERATTDDAAADDPAADGPAADDPAADDAVADEPAADDATADDPAADDATADGAGDRAGVPRFPRDDVAGVPANGAGADGTETGDDADVPADGPDGVHGGHAEPDATSTRSRGGGSFLRELPILLVVALVLAFLLRSFVVQVFYIPSSSMEPTLSVNDRMIVEKLTYRFRDPVRGEIVVFEGESLTDGTPDDTAGERFVRVVGRFLGVVPASARDFVKRVIGLPGDEILIRDGIVSVNGVPIDEPYVVFEDPSDYGPVTVPAGALFFLGDNRPNSSDSRRGLGFVPEDKVVGRSYAIIWPFANTGLLTGVEHDVDREEAALSSVGVEPLSGSP